MAHLKGESCNFLAVEKETRPKGGKRDCAPDKVRPRGGLEQSETAVNEILARSFEQSSNSILEKGATIPKGMAHLGGESSNTLFDILAQWNQVLSAIQIPANAPERDICGVAR